MRKDIRGFINSLKTYINLNYVYHFGIRNAFYGIICKFLCRRNWKIGYKVSQNQHREIEKYIIKNYGKFINKVRLEYGRRTINTNSKQIPIQNKNLIWTMWWQGEDLAPDIVKCCINRMRRYSNGAEVIVLDKNNIFDYLELNPIILKKLRNNELNFTHLSDFIRMNLLYEYGGLWLDSTILVTSDILDDIYAANLYSLHSSEQGYHVSNLRWTSYILGGNKNNKLFYCAKRIFEYYIEKESIFINYILIDFIIDILYKYDSEITEMINNIPLIDGKPHELVKKLDNAYNEKEFKEIISKSIFYKLTYKAKFQTKTKNNDTTLYGYILDV